MAKVDDIIADLPLTPKGKQAIAEYKVKMAAAPKAEMLSDDRRVLPFKYRNLYNTLLVSNPAKAQELWDKAAHDPNPIVQPKDKMDKHESALHALGRVGMDNTLKRRV